MLMSGDLRNFDLTVEEIKIVRMIKELIKNLEKLSFDVPQTCTACGWQGKSQDRDRVPDPRGQKIWYVCPRCRMPEHFKEA